MIEKPHRGTIDDWFKLDMSHHPYAMGLGFLIAGSFGDARIDLGHAWTTSWIISHDEALNEIETVNSRYSLGRPLDPARVANVEELLRLSFLLMTDERVLN